MSSLSIVLCGSYVHFGERRGEGSSIWPTKFTCCQLYRYYLWVTKAPCVAL